ncbi:hypothetical protein C8Q79DRAFT_927954 [Trametes meyenii]|nr:hypothetical protein C8Q79DRAFT_927954 [Trametes meyenii]
MDATPPQTPTVDPAPGVFDTPNVAAGTVLPIGATNVPGVSYVTMSFRQLADGMHIKADSAALEIPAVSDVLDADKDTPSRVVAHYPPSSVPLPREDLGDLPASPTASYNTRTPSVIDDAVSGLTSFFSQCRLESPPGSPPVIRQREPHGDPIAAASFTRIVSSVRRQQDSLCKAIESLECQVSAVRDKISENLQKSTELLLKTQHKFELYSLDPKG